jgi:hypothetical protein
MTVGPTWQRLQEEGGDTGRLLGRGGLQHASWTRSKKKRGVRKKKLFSHFSKEVKQMNSNTDLNSTKQK